MHDEAKAANRRRWEEMVTVNLDSDLYDLTAFKRGERRGLHPFEWHWLVDVAGSTCCICNATSASTAWHGPGRG